LTVHGSLARGVAWQGSADQSTLRPATYGAFVRPAEPRRPRRRLPVGVTVCRGRASVGLEDGSGDGRRVRGGSSGVSAPTQGGQQPAGSPAATQQRQPPIPRKAVTPTRADRLRASRRKYFLAGHDTPRCVPVYGHNPDGRTTRLPIGPITGPHGPLPSPIPRRLPPQTTATTTLRSTATTTRRSRGDYHPKCTRVTTPQCTGDTTRKCTGLLPDQCTGRSIRTCTVDYHPQIPLAVSIRQCTGSTIRIPTASFPN